ncbi:hypothetical protein [Streptomyces sp. NBC_00063]|uniref:hypothetical protein n=1 Tax=Streptomyces sp. NBC_00063 TaxID=2975638 RepID=UPI003D70FC36
MWRRRRPRPSSARRWCHIERWEAENIARKLGMTEGHEFVHPQHGYPLQVHEIVLTEYEG